LLHVKRARTGMSARTTPTSHAPMAAVQVVSDEAVVPKKKKKDKTKSLAGEQEAPEGAQRAAAAARRAAPGSYDDMFRCVCQRPAACTPSVTSAMHTPPALLAERADPQGGEGPDTGQIDAVRYQQCRGRCAPGADGNAPEARPASRRSPADPEQAADSGRLGADFRGPAAAAL
ncbi:MAG: hypothetical protein ACPIOQ_51115, partial [Promethearchaeia archaeon]